MGGGDIPVNKLSQSSNDSLDVGFGFINRTDIFFKSFAICCSFSVLIALSDVSFKKKVSVFC